MPQAVVEAQQEPVRNNSLAPFAHRLGGRGSACGEGAGSRGGWREKRTGRRPGEGWTEDPAAFASLERAGGSGESGGVQGAASGSGGGPVPQGSSGGGTPPPISFLLERRRQSRSSERGQLLATDIKTKKIKPN